MNRRDKRLQELFAVLVEEHAAMLITYLTGLTGSRHDAEDLAQETFLRAYRHFAKLGSKPTNLPAWLRRIARNLVIDRSRKRRIDTVQTDPQILDGLGEMFDRMDRYGPGDTWCERVDTLRDCVRDLPDHLRSVCVLHYFEGKTARVIGAQFNVSLSAVLKRLERLRHTVRACVEQKLGLAGAESA